MERHRDDQPISISVPGIIFGFLIIIVVWLLALAFVGGIRSGAFDAFPPIEGKTLDNFSAWGTFGDTFNVVSTLFSALAFAAVALSLFIQRADFKASLVEIQNSANAQKELAEETRAERRERWARLYAEFSSERMYEARSELWHKLNQWYSTKNTTYKNKFIYYSEDRHSLTKEEHNDYSHASDIIDFYLVIYDSMAYNDLEMREAANRYFYHAWRGFIISFALINKKYWETNCKTKFEKKQLPFWNAFDKILEFDKKVCDVQFSHCDHFFYKGLPSCGMYPGLDEHNSAWLSPFTE